MFAATRLLGLERHCRTAFHEFIEGFNRVPPAGVEADAWDAKFVRDLNAFDGVINVFLTFGGVGRDEILVNGKADEIDAVQDGVALEFLTIGTASGVERRPFLDVHLTVENVNCGSAQDTRVIDNFLDGDFSSAEMPVGVGRDAELHQSFLRSFG